MPICKLCHKDKPLIKKSHIIPDFLYKNSGMYNEHHKIYTFSLNELKEGKKATIISTGEYEGNILCAECDGNIIGTYENYGQLVIFGGFKKPPFPVCNNYFDSSGAKFTICENVDYRKYKLFMLSILWRISISSRAIFSDCKLDKEKEETLRKMIYEGQPKSFYDFPIFTGHNLKDNTIPRDLIVQPLTVANNKVVLILPGFVHVFEVNDIRKGVNLEELKNSTISEDNKVMFYELDNGMTMDFLKKMSGL